MCPKEHREQPGLTAANTAFAQGDLNGYLQYCTDKITLCVPGKGKISGMFTRDQFSSRWVSSFMELTNGTFRKTLNGVVAMMNVALYYEDHQ